MCGIEKVGVNGMDMERHQGGFQEKAERRDKEGINEWMDLWIYGKEMEDTVGGMHSNQCD